MIRSAITISLVPEARGGPFVFWDGLEAGCERAAAHGFDAVEIFPRSAGECGAETIRRATEGRGLRVAAIGTGAGWVAHRLRLTDPDAGVRRQAVEFVRSIMGLAAGFGAPAIIGSMQGRAEAGLTREESLKWLVDALAELGDDAGKLGAPLLIEPLNRYETNLLNTVDDALDVIARSGASRVCVLCDLFHMNIEETSVSEALLRAGDRLGHVHLADSNRRAAGLGHTDLKPVADALARMGYTGYVSAEVLPLPDAETAAGRTMGSFRALFRRTS